MIAASVFPARGSGQGTDTALYAGQADVVASACLAPLFHGHRLRAPGVRRQGQNVLNVSQCYDSEPFDPASWPAGLSLGLVTNGVSKQALRPELQ